MTRLKNNDIMEEQLMTTFIIKDENAVDKFAKSLKNQLKKGKKIYFTTDRPGTTDINAPSTKKDYYRLRANFAFAKDVPEHESFMKGAISPLLLIIEGK